MFLKLLSKTRFNDLTITNSRRMPPVPALCPELYPNTPNRAKIVSTKNQAVT